MSNSVLDKATKELNITPKIIKYFSSLPRFSPVERTGAIHMFL